MGWGTLPRIAPGRPPARGASRPAAGDRPPGAAHACRWPRWGVVRPWRAATLRRYSPCDGARTPGPAPAPREGPHRRPVPRPARRARARPRRPPVARPLQPRVPPDVRRDAAPVPAHAPPRARGGAAAHDRPLRRRHLPDGRADQRRLVHDELRPRVRMSPTAYRAAHPPAAARARIPTCVLRAWDRPPSSSFREDSWLRRL